MITLDNFKNKIGLMGCKWTSFSAPGTETSLFYPFLAFWNLELRESPLLTRVIRNCKYEHFEYFKNKIGLVGSKWSSLNTPGKETPLSHPILELAKLPSLTISPLG